MCMSGMVEGPKIWGTKEYKLSISVSICISGGKTLEGIKLVCNKELDFFLELLGSAKKTKRKY